jgi:hypothetical protein
VPAAQLLLPIAADAIGGLRVTSSELDLSWANRGVVERSTLGIAVDH